MLPGFLLHQSFGNRADSGRFRRALTQQYYVGELVNVGSDESYQPSVHQRTVEDAERQREGAGVNGGLSVIVLQLILIIIYYYSDLRVFFV